MENPIVAPDTGRGPLTPKEAKKFFEFFPAGTEREVIMLGDLVEQRVHFVRWKNHKVLCAARLGKCDLCAQAGTSAEISDGHPEFYAASFIKGPKDRAFKQQVAVFTHGVGKQLLAMVTEGSMRGHRIAVHRQSNQKCKLRIVTDSLRGLAHVVPQEFDLLPFIRARFGLPQDPARPAVILPPIDCRELVSGPVHKPRPLDISAEDVKPTGEVLAKLHEYVKGFTAAPAPADDQAEDVETTPAPVKSIDVPAIAANPANYGPRKQVNGQHTNGHAEKTPGAELLGDVLANIPANHPARQNGRKGGA